MSSMHASSYLALEVSATINRPLTQPPIALQRFAMLRANA